MTRSRRLVGSAAAGFAAACLLAPAAAYDTTADDPVTMNPTPEEAPVVPVGLHTLKMPVSDAPEYFTVKRQIENSTIWVGETLVTTKPSDASMYVNMSADATNQDCGDGANFSAYYNRHDMFTGVTRTAGDCATSDQVTISHQGWDAGAVLGDAQLMVWEEPPVVDASILPPPATSLPWVTKKLPARGSVELGASFADAPELLNGQWDVHIDPGKTALFKVPLDWNQHLQLELTYDGAETPDNVMVSPILITPLGGESDWAAATGDDKPSFSDIDLKYASLDGGVVSPSITWRNREADDVTAAFPGTYYVLLRLGQKDVQKQGADITIAPQVITDKEPSSPYAQEADPIPALDGSDTVDEETKKAAASSSSDSTPWGAVGGLFAGSAAMAAVGFVALGRHRRRA